jgi:HAD superfamily hydrolase (TIGR01509 family)
VIQALIFDFDGTILDTETPEFEVWQGVYTHHGTRLELTEWAKGIGTWDAFDPHAHLETLTGKSFDKDDLHTIVRGRVHEIIHALTPIPGVLDALENARARGLRLAVASSSSLDWVSDHLERLGLLGFFESLSTRYDVERVKPDPALYFHALEQLGLQPAQAVAIEDSPNGAKAALTAGLRAVVVPNAVTQTLVFPDGVTRLERLDWAALDALLSRQWSEVRSQK